MRKLILVFGIFLISLTSFTQHNESVWDIQLVTGAPPSTIVVPINGDITMVHIFGTAAPSTDVAIVPSGTPSYPMTIEGIYYADITNAAGVKFFHVKIPDEMLDDTVYMRSTYTSTGWKTTIHPNMGAVAGIPVKAIDPTGFDNSTIELDASNGLQVKDDGITMAKLEPIAAGKIILGNATNDATETTLTGDILLDDAGATTLQINTVATANIIDEAVTVDKMADLAEGNFLIGGTSDRPEALDVSTSASILIGDGTTMVSVAMSGDIGLNAAGTTIINTDAITGTEIADGAIAVEKIETLSPGQILVADGSGIPAAATMTGGGTMSATGVLSLSATSVGKTELESEIDQTLLTQDASAPSGQIHGVMASKVIDEVGLKALLDMNTNPALTLLEGEVLLGFKVVIQTVGGAGTIDIGIASYDGTTFVDDDAVIKSADANVTGFYLADNATYSGASMVFGYYENTETQSVYVTVKSSVNYTATGIIGRAVMYYIPKN